MVSKYDPKLRVASSGYKGSGYFIPTDLDPFTGKPVRVPGVTTITGALPAPGIIQWSCDQTAAYAVANADRLLDRTEEQGFKYLRFYHSRKVDYDDPATDIHNYHTGVLNDLAELGTITHEWVTSFLLGVDTPEVTRDEHAEMIEQFLDWYSQHEVEVVEAESTVYNQAVGYAGTMDFILRVDGETMLVDAKTSRAVRDGHIAQLSALGAATTLMREVGPDEGVEYKSAKWGKTYWREDGIPGFSKYAVLQLRPSDVTNKGEYIAPFCRLEVIEPERISAAHQAFLGALEVRRGLRALEQVEKRLAAEVDADPF